MRLPLHIDTAATVCGDEKEVRCEYDYQPPEPDVNVGESVTVTSVYRFEGCVVECLPLMSDREVEALEEELLLLIHEYATDYRDERGEYLRQLGMEA